MKKMNLKSICTVFCAVFCLTAISIPEQKVSANAESVSISGNSYQFGEKSAYNFSSSEPIASPEEQVFLGELTLEAEIQNTFTDDKQITAFEIKDDTKLKFKYSFDDSLNRTGEKEWHITEDDTEKVNGIKVGREIKKGALIYQTSYNAELWATNKIETNILGAKGAENHTITFQSDENNNQLMNGCYYRIIIAYELEKTTERFGPIPDKHDYKKYAQVYTFYASYKDARKNETSNLQKYTYSTSVKTDLDKGFSGEKAIDVKDPHFGWEIGNFYLSGYTQRNDDDTYIKTLGDKLTLWFSLKQDIYKLNGNSNYYISEDKNGYDQAFQVPKTNFGHGTLLVRFTDYQGKKHEPQTYTNFLEASCFPGANIRVNLFEEGDYEVELVYEIKNKSNDSYTNYKLAFNFKIRNGNCMVYPKDVLTKSDLKNNSVTENGFTLDLAKSRYLKINVKMDTYTQGANGYTTDTRFSRAAADGDQYTEPGVYTITVKNPSTEDKITKQIYVGSDMVLVAYVNPQNVDPQDNEKKRYSVDQIAYYVNNGASVAEDGTLLIPEDETQPVHQETVTTSQEEITESTTSTTETSGTVTTSAESNDFPMIPVAAGGAGAILLGAVGIGVLHSRKKKPNAGKEEQ